MRTVLSVLGVAVLMLTLAGISATRTAAQSRGDFVNGRKMFLKNNCYICHGGRGGGGMCPSLRADKPDAGDVVEVVNGGTESGMPSFRRVMTQQEIRDVAAYIQTLRTSREPTFTHWWEPGVPTQ
jgi:mono/diheme cytochrome c family protein